MNILKKADELIHGEERVAAYGTPTESFHEIATMATIATGKELDAEDICTIFIVAKLVRRSYSPTNIDHLLDIAGYAGIAGDLAQQTK